MHAMQAGEVPARLRVAGDLHFYRQYKVVPPRALPAEALEAGRIVIHDASLLTRWPRLVRCHTLILWNFQLDFAPDAVLELVAPADVPAWDARDLTLQNCPHLTHLPRLRGDVPHEIAIQNCPALEELPVGLRASTLRLSQCPRLVTLDADLEVSDTLEVVDCPRLSRLPGALHAERVSLSGCAELRALPDDCAVVEALNLFGCAGLTHLPEHLETLQLNIANCRGLTALPRHLRSLYIAMDGCTGLTRWDDPEVTALRQLSARGCANLASLPPHLGQIDELDVSGCPRLARLPEGLRVTRWVDVGGSGVRTLPAAAQGTQVRWNGVNVTGQIAFHPETLSARQALAEENAELRRVMLERMGPERFIAEARPRQLDADRDVGGERRLLRVNIPDDEPLLVLQVRDPSTGRQYLLRVPPDVSTCRQAAAWIAGFDDPDEYRPVMET